MVELRIKYWNESDVIHLTHDMFVNRTRFWRDRATHMENVVKTLDIDGTYWIYRDVMMEEYTFEFVFGPHMQGIQQDSDIDDKSDEPNEHGDVSFIHMARAGIHMEHVECTQTLVDSDANVTLCPPELFKKLQLIVKKSRRPLAIEFANDTITHSDAFVDLGPFLGLSYVVDNVNSVIVSCSRANARGFSF
jgi:hypothetical protein